MSSDREAERPQLLAALVGDPLRTPRRHPDPVDLVVGHDLLPAEQHRAGLVLDHVGQRACGRRQRHVDGGDVVLADPDVVHQAEIDDVDPQLGVDHVAQRLLHVLDRGHRARVGLGLLRQVGRGSALAGRVLGPEISAPSRAFSTPACTKAALTAIQPSSAHFTLAGYFATPANATPSSSTSSSGSTLPRPCINSTNASSFASASSTGRSTTRSVSTDTDAWEIEQPWPVCDTSAIRSPSSFTRSCSSSPHVGLIWYDSPSYGSRKPRPCGFL